MSVSEETALRKTPYITDLIYPLKAEQLGQSLDAAALAEGEDAGAEQTGAGGSTFS